jgi:serine/threonine-protein kinase
MADLAVSGFNLIKQLSTYGPAETWKAHAERVDQFVIIHFLPLDQPISENDQRKFLREAGICARLSHPGLVRFLTQGIAGSRLWFASELAQGIDLAQFVEKRQPVTMDTAVNILLQALDVVIYLHQQGIVHRGLRPESLLIQEKSEGLTVQLADLGSAKCFRTAELEATVTKLGERGFPIHAYTALEALENPQKLDPRSDIYALGALLYFLLSGCPPYEADDETLLMMQIIDEKPQPLQALRPGLPEPLVHVIECAMEPDMATRYGSTEEMRRALRQATGKSDPSVEPTPTPQISIHMHGDLINGDKTTVGDISGSTDVAIGPEASTKVIQHKSTDQKRK